jgi:hypothetical protein
VSESLILSLIFVGIIVLIGFIGASFGIARGFLATTSILLGAEAALWWGGNLGDRLSDAVDMRAETGHFLCGMALLILTVLLLGVGGSIVLSWGTPTRWGSMLGAALGAANGALLVAMALRLYYLAYAGSATSLPLDDSLVTRVLWRNYDWFVLVFITVSSSLLLYTRFARLTTFIPDPSARMAYSRPIPPPVPSAEPRQHRAQRPATSPNGVALSNGANADSPGPGSDDAIFAPPQPAPVPTGGPVTVERETLVKSDATQTGLPTARNPVRFCPNCGMTLDASDRFCPDCGYTL